MSGPLFHHDCKSCVFLGRYQGHDLYVCPPAWGFPGSVIARFGSDGPEYESVPSDLRWFMDPLHPLSVARQLAVEHRLLPALTTRCQPFGWLKIEEETAP